MQFDLVDSRHHVGRLKQSGQVLGHEVADPDSTHLSVGELASRAPVAGQSRMDDVRVHRGARHPLG